MRRSGVFVAAAITVVAVGVLPSAARASSTDRVAVVSAGMRAVPASGDLTDEADWSWPVAGYRIVDPYLAPAHRYAPGHRGIDLAPTGTGTVRAPSSGTIAFSGSVAGRGILTIDHGGGLVTTLEPIATNLVVGALVASGDIVGTIDHGGHTAVGALHFGVRLDGDYINPLLLLGGIPHAVLLPCCGAVQ